jgi:WD40 repeat protein
MKIKINDAHMAVFCVSNEVRVFCMKKGKIIFQRKMDFDVSWGTLLRQTQFFALVSGKTLFFWDDKGSVVLGKLEFTSTIVNLEFQSHHVFVLCEHAMFVYEFPNLCQIWRSEKSAEQDFLSLFYDLDFKTAAFPSFSRTKVHIFSIDSMQSHAISVSESTVVCASICPRGKWLATASQKGTLIRLFDMETGEPLKELRRGLDQVAISCLCFAPDRMWLAVASDKGTAHIFALNMVAESPSATFSKSSELKTSIMRIQRRFTQEEEEEKEKEVSQQPSSLPLNKKSAFAFAENYLPKYFQSEWSFATFKLERFKGKILCYFPLKESNTLQKFTVMNTSGHCWWTEFHVIFGGECVAENYKCFSDGR